MGKFDLEDIFNHILFAVMFLISMAAVALLGALTGWCMSTVGIWALKEFATLDVGQKAGVAAFLLATIVLGVGNLMLWWRKV